MPNQKRLRPRLFLEGYEIPCQSCAMAGGVNTPVTAEFAMIPTPSLQNILPRTLVHLVCEDPYAAPNDRNWYLAFEGEYHALTFSKTSSSRSFTAHAMDYSNYFDNAKAYFYNAQFAGNLGGSIGNPGTPSNNITPALAFAEANQLNPVIPTSTGAANWMVQQIQTALNVPGNDITDAVKSVLQQFNLGNAFLRLAEVRLRIAERIVSQKVGAGVAALLNNEAVLSAFDATSGQAEGGLASLREVLLSALQFIFHDMVFSPFPSKVPSTIQNGFVSKGQTMAPNQIMIKPNIYFAPPPQCNVVFPSMYTGFSFTRNFFEEVTRMEYRPSFTVAPPGDGTSDGIAAQNFVFFPYSFSDFMRGNNQHSFTSGPYDLASLYGTAYQQKLANQNYGQSDSQGVVSTIYPNLRQNDFLTNEEAIRGIFEVTETSVPNADNIIANIPDPVQRDQYFQKICTYLFFKKRFEPRSFDVTTVFNPHLAPGFPVLLLDESEANFTIVGYLQGISHQVSTNNASTTFTVTYGRPLSELITVNGQIFEPPIPPWFDPTIWGAQNQGAQNTETQQLLTAGEITQTQATVRNSSQLNVWQDISAQYQALLGIGPITMATGAVTRVTIDGAVAHLLKLYRAAASGGDTQEFKFTSSYIRRPLITMEEAFWFIDATLAANTSSVTTPNTIVTAKDIYNDNYLVFGAGLNGARKALYFTDSVNVTMAQLTAALGKGYEYLRATQVIALKRTAVQNYVQEVQSSRGQVG